MKLEITGSDLHVSFSFWEHVFAVKGNLSISLSKIVSVHAQKPAFKWHLRLPGTYLPGVVKMGSYYWKEWEFWNWRKGKQYLVIELKDHKYKRLVLGLDDADFWAERINTLKK